MSDDGGWEQTWNERVRALEAVLGPQDGGYHAVLPFQLGGQADVLVFRGHLEGAVCVTADLTGPEDEGSADYELMIAQRGDPSWGANVISRLAPYTLEAYVGSGDTMDIDGATPATSAIKAFVFDTYGRFHAFGQTLELRLCIGITKEELEFKLRYGAEKLIERLKAARVYPYTDLERGSVSM